MREESSEKILMVLPLVFLLYFTFSCQQGEEGITEEAKAIGDTYAKARNEVNLSLLDEIYDKNVVIHDCSTPEDIVGLDALKKYYSYTHKAFPDLHAAIDETIVKDDNIIWKWTFAATHTGPFHTPLGDIPATGNKVQFSGIVIESVKGGKIFEEWVYFNVLDVLMQLGFTLNPPQPPEPLVEKK